MDHGLRVQLSPDEEIALHEIATASNVEQISQAHLQQLVALWLIASRGGKRELTDFGKTRLAGGELRHGRI